MKKIAVIGGGIFGCETALRLASDGNIVKLFEKNEGILMGATANSQNRLHLGLHYPRDLMTAVQSALGFALFEERFPSSIRSGFPNMYVIAKDHSKVNRNQFLQFARQANIALSECPSSLLEDLGLDRDQIQGSWICNEAVIDFDILRDLIDFEISKSERLDLHLLEEVVSLEQFGTKWYLSSRSIGSSTSGNCATEDFDIIVRATYSSDSIMAPAIPMRTIEYQQTMVGVARSNISPFGLTIVDGDFLTILPRGMSNDFLVYAPSISVTAKHVGTDFPQSWYIKDEVVQGAFRSEISERIAEWIPNWDYALSNQTLQTVRSIDPSVSRSDRRTSSIRELHGSYFEVWSGKIDHAVEMAQYIRLAIERHSS